jgi:hypothetical protein
MSDNDDNIEGEVTAQMKQSMRSWFEVEYGNLSEASRDFMIQYSYLERIDDYYAHVNEDLWTLRADAYLTEDGIYDIDSMEYSDDETIVKFYSYKGNHSKFTINSNEFDDNRDCSTNDRVYIVDLYPDHEIKHFKGVVWTRGPWFSQSF